MSLAVSELPGYLGRRHARRLVSDIDVLYDESLEEEQYPKESTTNLVPSPYVPPSEKRSGEQSRIYWAYYPKVVRTNEIARLLHSTSLIAIKFFISS